MQPHETIEAIVKAAAALYGFSWQSVVLLPDFDGGFGSLLSARSFTARAMCEFFCFDDAMMLLNTPSYILHKYLVYSDSFYRNSFEYRKAYRDLENKLCAYTTISNPVPKIVDNKNNLKAATA